MTFYEILSIIQDKIDMNNLYRINLSGNNKHSMDLENFLRENLSVFYFEIINNISEDDSVIKIEDEFILDLLENFSNSQIESDARELSKKYILEQYYDI